MKEFNSIGGFITHLTAMIEAETVALHHGLKKCAVIIEKTAQAEFGHYQDEVEYFPGWEQLKPLTLAYHEYMGVGESPLLVTGELYASISHEVHGLEAAIGSDSDIMVYQELGTATIPPRPVLGPAALRNKEVIEKVLGHAVAEGILYGSGETLALLE